ADLGLDDLDAALLADHAAVLHALVLAAVALVVLDRAEDLGAEQAVALGLERPVVDGLGLLDLAVRPLADLLRRGQHDADRGEGTRVLRLLEEVEDVLHGCSLRVFEVANEMALNSRTSEVNAKNSVAAGKSLPCSAC